MRGKFLFWCHGRKLKYLEKQNKLPSNPCTVRAVLYVLKCTYCTVLCVLYCTVLYVLYCTVSSVLTVRAKLYVLYRKVRYVLCRSYCRGRKEQIFVISCTVLPSTYCTLQWLRCSVRYTCTDHSCDVLPYCMSSNSVQSSLAIGPAFSPEANLISFNLKYHVM